MDHREYFNNKATLWDGICHHEHSRLRSILEHLRLFPGCRVLDVGCGTGVFAEFIEIHSEMPVEIICVDISEKMLEVARKKLGQYTTISYFCGDATDIDLPDKSLDRIICYSCIPHIQAKAAALRNFWRMLKSGGLLVIAHSDGYEKINEMHSHLEDPVRHDFLPGPEEMRSMLDRADFRNIQILSKTDLYIVSAEKE